MDPVIAKLLKEILSISCVKPLRSSNKLGAILNPLICQPYRWSESVGGFHTIEQKQLVKFQKILYLATAFIGVLSLYFQNNTSFADIVLQLMFSLLLAGFAFVINFNQKTCVLFSKFLNGMLVFHKGSKVD